ncbi:MAG: MFS transporter [Calditrichaeota bacterium]|nr:MFS transporter [Calditrichota bacterium]
MKQKDLPENYRWNFTMGLIHGVMFSFGMAFSEPFAVLPVFMNAFTKSKLLIGLMISIIKSGSALPQLLIARKMQGLAKSKPILIKALWIRWLAWGFLAVVTFVWGSGNPVFVVIAFVAFLTIFSIGGGIAAIPYFNMIAHAIPAERRGKFWGTKQFLGGLFAVAAGYLVKLILSSKKMDFPQNYSMLFFVTFVVLAISYTGLSLFREHEFAPKNGKKPPLLRQIKTHLRRYPPLGYGVLTNILSYSLFLSLPFFVLYAKEKLSFPAAWIGYFISAQMSGAILSNLIWSRISDRVGPATVIRGAVSMAFLAVTMALFANSFWSYLLVFVFVGFFMDGANIGFSNYFLEIGNAELRPLFLSISGTLKFPVYFFPLVGGIIVDNFGYQILFLTNLALIAIGFVLSFLLCEPRRGDKECEITYEITDI